MLRLMASLVVVIVAVGCKSRPLGPYISPRVTGQVLAADNHQPLAGVKVTRGLADNGSRRGSSPKGSELLMQKAPVRTDANGRFVLPSERVLSIVRGSGWDTVSLAFEREGYHHFQTNFPISLGTNSTTGEPVLNTTSIILQPATR